LQSLKAGAPLIIFLGWLTRPIRLLVLGVVRFVWRLWSGEALPDLDSLDLETQIELLRKESPEMSMVAQLILKNTLMMRELVVADVLLPRNQVKYFDLNLSLEDNLKIARESGHTRFPLCYGDLDRCLGLIHIKDIFRYPGDLTRMDLRRLKRNMIRIDSEEPLESALTKLLSHRMHMALVIDEFHGTEGVLTLERILEQLVGEIRDEFDADEEVLIKSDLKNDEAIVSGLTPLHEIESIFDTHLDAEEVSTIGGLVTSELGRIPETGECVQIENLAIEITGVDETRILEVRIRCVSSDDESADDSQGPEKQG
jgi:CBS domain containing-hemolysin-like protein